MVTGLRDCNYAYQSRRNGVIKFSRERCAQFLSAENRCRSYFPRHLGARFRNARAFYIRVDSRYAAGDISRTIVVFRKA